MTTAFSRAFCMLTLRQHTELPQALRDESLTDRQEVLTSLTLIAFLDAGMTGTAQATFYNTKYTQVKTLQGLQTDLLSADRALFLFALLLPGLTDFARQTGIVLLLKKARSEQEKVGIELENAIIRYLLRQLTVPRQLQCFEMLRRTKVNNARTRKLILRHLLNSEKLELWSVRYRKKIARSLTHAWGKRRASILRNILRKQKGPSNPKEQAILRQWVDPYLFKSERTKTVYDCVSFVLGNETYPQAPLLKAYKMAKQDLKAGTSLPFEVLEGIRSVYHKRYPSAQVLELTKSHLTQTQQMRFQAKAERAGVSVAFEPGKQNPLRLYVYAYQRGMDTSIQEALRQKAEATATQLPFRLGKVGILIDNSLSMQGSEKQFMRPMAACLALRDVLVSAATESIVRFTQPIADETLPNCEGATELAGPLVDLVEEDPDLIFMLTDGYENTPQKRVADLLRAFKKIGWERPIMQATPVMAAESGGIRRLSTGILALPFHRVESLGTGLLALAFHQGLEIGKQSLWQLVRSAPPIKKYLSV